MAEKEEEEETADWSDDLPYDLMEQILNQLTNVPSKFADVSNYARWAAVYVSWRAGLYNDYDLHIHPQLPLLMIPGGTDCNAPYSNGEAADGFCSFYRTTDDKVLDQFKVRMPRNSHCCGSGHGWLIMVDDDLDKGFPVRLFNPFLSEEIPLPSLKHLPVIKHNPGNEDPDPDPCNSYTYYLHKAILSVEPLSHPDYIVMAIYGNKFRRLAFLRSGDKTWTPIERNTMFADVNQARYMKSGRWKRAFMAVTHKGNLVNIREESLFALNDEPQKGQYAKVRGPPSIHTKKLYLVPIDNTWMLVLRTIDIHDEDEKTNSYSTKEFKVFRFVGEEVSKLDWKETDNFCGRTLFVGNNNSMFINGAEYPGCKPDCIYYTDDYYPIYAKIHPQNGGPHDMGVFNVKEGSFEKHFLLDLSKPMWSVPVWIEPSLSLQKVRDIHKYFK